MGASGWIYFCERTDDRNTALRALRESVFRWEEAGERGLCFAGRSGD